MPNWVLNEVKVFGEAKRVSEFMARVEEHKEALFDHFVPMPDIFKKFDTTNHPYGEHLVIGQKASFDDETIVTQEYINECKAMSELQKLKYGVVGWYDWHCKYWGTKWDANNVETDYNSFVCDTAWSAPIPVIEKMASEYPDLDFLLKYADEDCGANCGAVIYAFGKVLENLDGSEAFGVSMWEDWEDRIARDKEYAEQEAM